MIWSLHLIATYQVILQHGQKILQRTAPLHVEFYRFDCVCVLFGVMGKIWLDIVFEFLVVYSHP